LKPVVRGRVPPNPCSRNISTPAPSPLAYLTLRLRWNSLRLPIWSRPLNRRKKPRRVDVKPRWKSASKRRRRSQNSQSSRQPWPKARRGPLHMGSMVRWCTQTKEPNRVTGKKWSVGVWWAPLLTIHWPHSITPALVRRLQPLSVVRIHYRNSFHLLGNDKAAAALHGLRSAPHGSVEFPLSDRVCPIFRIIATRRGVFDIACPPGAPGPSHATCTMREELAVQYSPE